jgi:transcriptional regulator with XRE-family HTH domain
MTLASDSITTVGKVWHISAQRASIVVPMFTLIPSPILKRMSPRSNARPKTDAAHTHPRWRDTYGGFRSCRDRLQHVLPGLSAAAVARAVDRDPAWYTRIETGQAAPTTENFARLASLYIGLLSTVFPDETHTLHSLIRDVPAPYPLPEPVLSSCPNDAPYCWQLERLRRELAERQGQATPVDFDDLSAGAQLHPEVLPEIAAGGPGSIQTLITLYHYLRPRIGRPLLLDDILTVPAAAPELIVRVHALAQTPPRTGRRPTTPSPTS